MEDEGGKQASAPRGRHNLASYVPLFLKNMQGNPAENRAVNGQHLNKPICRQRGFECGSPAVLRCGTFFKSPKMTMTTPFSKPHEVFMSFLLTFLLGSRSVSRTMPPFGWWLLKRLPVATSPAENRRRLFRTSKLEEEMSFDLLIINQSGASRFGLQRSGRWRLAGFLSLCLPGQTYWPASQFKQEPISHGRWINLSFVFIKD